MFTAVGRVLRFPIGVALMVGGFVAWPVILPLMAASQMLSLFFYVLAFVEYAYKGEEEEWNHFRSENAGDLWTPLTGWFFPFPLCWDVAEWIATGSITESSIQRLLSD